MRCRWLLLGLMVAALVEPSAAFGQGGQGGSIIGTVTDQSGTPIRGVKISAASDVLMGGKAVYSNDEGSFHMLGLPPGRYKLTATAPGMNPVVEENVEVGITSSAEVNLLMEVKTAEQTVTIVDKPAVISTTKAGVKEVYDIQLVERIPFNDPINQFRDIIDMTPGTINRRVRGGGQRQTLFTQDGFEIKEQFPSLKSSAAFEIQTAGYGADAPTASGGVENLVTRSGSNKFQFEFTAVGDASVLRLGADDGEPNTGQRRLILNPTFSGPIVKDRLWYHLNIETHFIQVPQPRDPLLILPVSQPMFNLIPKVTFKTRWQVTSRNKLEFLFNADLPYQRNNRTTAGIADDAQADRIAQRYFAGLTWESLLTDNLLFRSQVGYIAYLQNIYPSNCRSEPTVCLTIPNVQQKFPEMLEYDNAPKHDRQHLQSIQFINSLEDVVSTKHWGDHSLRLKDTVYIESDMQQTSETGNRLYEYTGTTADHLTTFYANDPRLAPAEYGYFTGTVNSIKHVLTASDTWKINRRLTALPALSFVQAQATNDRGTFPFNTRTWAPAVSLVWDLTGDGRTVLRTSGSVYVDVDLSLVARHAIGAQVTQRCGWNPATQQFDLNCAYTGGASKNTVGEPCGPSGVDSNGNSCKQSLQIPRTWEATLGGQRELAPGLALGLDVIYRKFTHQFEDSETNRIWNASGTAVVGYRSGVNETVLDLETPSQATRDYLGVTLSLTKKEGPLKLNGSYTWGRLYGTVLDGFQNYYGNVPPQNQFLYGPLADDHRHEIKLTGFYEVNRWFSTGFRYIYYSGTPANRLFYNEVSGKFDSYRARTGLDPGTNLNDPSDDRTLRLPDVQSLNLQLRCLLLPLIGHDASVFVEVINVLGLRTPLTEGVGDGRDFGLVLTRMDPLHIRLGLTYRWM